MKKNAMDIVRLINNDCIKVSEYDLYHACEDMDYKAQLGKQISNRVYSEEEKAAILLNNKEKFNLEKIVLVSGKNIYRFLQEYEDYQKGLRDEVSGVKVTSLNREQVIVSAELWKAKYEILKPYLKGISNCYVQEKYDDVNQKFRIVILDAKEMLGTKNKKKRAEKADKLENFLDKLRAINVNGTTGESLFYKTIEEGEILSIYPNKDFSDTALSYSVNKFLQRKTGKTREEIAKIKRDPEKMYYDFFQKSEGEFARLGLVDTIKELAEYADIDKFIIHGAYQLSQNLELIDFEPDKLQVAKGVFQEILNYCNENKINKVKMQIDIKGTKGKETIEVSYSKQDIEGSLKRFIDNEYMSDTNILALKEFIKSGLCFITDIPSDKLSVAFSDNDLKEFLFTNFINYTFIINRLNLEDAEILSIAKQQGLKSENVLDFLIKDEILSVSELLDLYVKGDIEEDKIRIALKEKNYIDELDFNQLTEAYKRSKQDKNKEEEYKKYQKFYKLIAEGQEEEFSEKYMADFAEHYDQKDRAQYIEQLEHFYNEGLLNIKSIISWEDEKIISNFWEDKIINIDELTGLYEQNIVTEECFQKIYVEYVSSKEIEPEIRMEALKKGYVSEEDIVRLYGLNLISMNDLNELIKQGLVDENNKTLKKMRLEDFEKNANIVLGDLSALTKQRDVYSNSPNTGYIPNQEKPKKPTVIIDPNDRENLFRLLKARLATAKMDPENPFYDYEFYAIPDESGELGENSVVIAERYYENKISEATFATNNATYFFRYKDLLYLSNLKKSEMMQERKNVVFTAYHVLGNDKKVGRWGTSVVLAIAKTMLGQDLKDIKRKSRKEYDRVVLDQLLKVYTLDELAEAWNFAGEIDRGDYNAEVVEER